MKQYSLISADSHVVEPAGVFVDYIEPKYRERAPRIVRDISCAVEKSARTRSLMSALEKAGGSLLISLEFISLYAGKETGKGMKSITLRALFGSGEKTLTDAEADHALQDMIRGAQAVFPFEVR